MLKNVIDRCCVVLICAHACDWLVPVLLGDSVEGGKNQRQYDLTVFLYQTEDVLVVPKVKSPLCYLKHTEKTWVSFFSWTPFYSQAAVLMWMKVHFWETVFLIALFCHLKVRARDARCDLFEERFLNPNELRRLNDIQDLLYLPQEHHLNAQEAQEWQMIRTFVHLSQVYP